MSLRRPFTLLALLAVVASLLAVSPAAPAGADGTAQALPFSQDWSDPSLITTNDDWSGVPGVLGFLGGALSILLCNRLTTIAMAPEALPYRFLPLAVFAVPLYDLVTVVGLRLRRGLAPWTGDTNHVSHRLAAAGLGRKQAVLVLCALAALTAFPCAVAMGLGPVGAWWSLGAAAATITLFGVVDLRLARQHPAP